MKIEFIEIGDKPKGYVELQGKKLVGSNTSMQRLVDMWLNDGRTVEEFVQYYTDWTSGYLTSRLVPED